MSEQPVLFSQSVYPFKYGYRDQITDEIPGWGLFLHIKMNIYLVELGYNCVPSLSYCLRVNLAQSHSVTIPDYSNHVIKYSYSIGQNCVWPHCEPLVTSQWMTSCLLVPVTKLTFAETKKCFATQFLTCEISLQKGMSLWFDMTTE